MIAKVSRGSRVSGLVAYLMGPGKSDEHTDQHVIAASSEMSVPDRTLSAPGARTAFTQELNHYYDLYGRPPMAKGEVYHFSLSNPADDRVLADEEWAYIARGAVAELGFDSAGKAPARWTAIRHGLSSAGNDHIHVAVVMVRADGTRAVEPRGDYRVLNQYCARMERQYGLIGDRTPARAGAGTVPEPSRADQEISARIGEAVPLKTRVQRDVRAAAAASNSETEFVTNLRAAGLYAHPRYAPGGRSEVTGYKVAALREQDPEGHLVYFAGGKLARDLSLPALRARWQDSPQERERALTAWAGTATGVGVPRIPDQRAAAEAGDELAAAAEALGASSDPGWAQWSELAGRTSGLLAAASHGWEKGDVAGLDKASIALARASQLPTTRPPVTPRRAGDTGLSDLALVLLAGSRRGASPFLMLQLARTVETIADVAVARSRTATARAELARLQATSHPTGDLVAGISAAASTVAGRSVRMSETPDSEAAESLRPLLVGAATAATLASRHMQQRTLQETEEARRQSAELREQQRLLDRDQRDAQRRQERAEQDAKRVEERGRQAYQTVSRDKLWLESSSAAELRAGMDTLAAGPGDPRDKVAMQRIAGAGNARFGPGWLDRDDDRGRDAAAGDAPTSTEAARPEKPTQGRREEQDRAGTRGQQRDPAAGLDSQDLVKRISQQYGIGESSATQPSPQTPDSTQPPGAPPPQHGAGGGPAPAAGRARPYGSKWASRRRTLGSASTGTGSTHPAAGSDHEEERGR